MIRLCLKLGNVGCDIMHSLHAMDPLYNFLHIKWCPLQRYDEILGSRKRIVLLHHISVPVCRKSKVEFDDKTAHKCACDVTVSWYPFLHLYNQIYVHPVDE